jgi:hypothetical protein
LNGRSSQPSCAPTPITAPPAWRNTSE